MGDAGGGENFLKASLRQSGSRFAAASYGTRERVPFRFVYAVGILWHV
jgi:hypothetical protein